MQSCRKARFSAKDHGLFILITHKSTENPITWSGLSFSVCHLIASLFDQQEFIHVILKDSKVLSVLSRRRGEKGWREMQGEALRSLLLGVVRTEVGTNTVRLILVLFCCRDYTPNHDPQFLH